MSAMTVILTVKYRNTEYWISIPAPWLRSGDVWNHSLQIQGILGVPGWFRGTSSAYSRGAISWVPIAHMHCYVNWSVIRVFTWHNQRWLLSSQLLHVGHLLRWHCIAGWSLAASSRSSSTTAHQKLRREQVVLEARLKTVCTQMGHRRKMHHVLLDLLSLG